MCMHCAKEEAPVSASPRRQKHIRKLASDIEKRRFCYCARMKDKVISKVKLANYMTKDTHASHSHRRI